MILLSLIQVSILVVLTPNPNSDLGTTELAQCVDNDGHIHYFDENTSPKYPPGVDGLNGTVSAQKDKKYWQVDGKNSMQACSGL